MTNAEEVKEQFYSYLRNTIHSALANGILTLIGNFVARIGSVFEKWKGVLGSHNVGECNGN